MDQVVEINMNDIYVDEEFNCRGRIPPASVIELAENIEKRGLLYPVVVRTWSDPNKHFPGGKKHSLVAGFRRYTAFKILERESIPSYVRVDMLDDPARIENLEENLLREDLNILQEARAIEPLMKTYDLDKIGRMFGRSKGWAYVRAQLLLMPYEIQQEAAAGTINQTHIKDLAKLPKEKQFEAVRSIKERKLSGEKARTSIKSKKPFKKRVRQREELFEMQDYIRETFGEGKVSNLGDPFKLACRILGWAAGEVSDFELHCEFRNVLHGNYHIPEEILLAN